MACQQKHSSRMWVQARGCAVHFNPTSVVLQIVQCTFWLSVVHDKHSKMEQFKNQEFYYRFTWMCELTACSWEALSWGHSFFCVSSLLRDECTGRLLTPVFGSWAGMAATRVLVEHLSIHLISPCGWCGFPYSVVDLDEAVRLLRKEGPEYHLSHASW